MIRNKFSLSNYKLFTGILGKLYPIKWYPVLPGDIFQGSTSALVRFNTMVAPIMHPVKVRIHHYYVPLRLIWDDFEDFITGGEDGTDTTAHPIMDTMTIARSDLGNYLGLPPGTYNVARKINALPFRAYSLIWNENYKDQDLQVDMPMSKANGTDTNGYYIDAACWEKDYSTTARTWEQRGAEVTIPSTTTMDLDELRLGVALQKFRERMGSFGARYNEYLRSIGVKSSDGRLDIPEYLAGGSSTLQFSEVLANTAATGQNLGDLGGHGISAVRSNRFRRYFEEHGILMSVLSVVPKHIISEGISKHFFPEVKEDYFQHELQFIGNQAIMNKEICSAHTTPEGTFGYQERYDHYKFEKSDVAGEFSKGGTLNHWHLAREFASDPALNGSFVKCTPSNRIFADLAADQIIVMCHNSVQARRQMKIRATARMW